MNLTSISTIVKVVFTTSISAFTIKILYANTLRVLLSMTLVILHKVKFVKKFENRGDLCITE